MVDANKIFDISLLFYVIVKYFRSFFDVFFRCFVFLCFVFSMFLLFDVLSFYVSSLRSLYFIDSKAIIFRTSGTPYLIQGTVY